MAHTVTISGPNGDRKFVGTVISYSEEIDTIETTSMKEGKSSLARTGSGTMTVEIRYNNGPQDPIIGGLG